MTPDVTNEMVHEVLAEVPAEGSSASDPTLSENEAPPSPKTFSKKRMGLALAGVLLLTATAFGVHTLSAPPQKAQKTQKAGRNSKDQVTPVTVATATKKTVPVQLSVIGNVQAGETVAVTPQAGGRITGVFFKKGDTVQKGQLLFTIDDRSQTAAMQQSQGIVAKDQAQVQQARATLAKDLGQVDQARAILAKDQSLVRQAQATLAKDEAQAQFAESQSVRYTNLYNQGAVTLDQAQQYIAAGKVSAATLQADRDAIANAQAVVQGDQVAIPNAEAVVKGDQAAIANAQAVVSSDSGALNNTAVQSSYTKISAPIDGRAGNILITEGNVVQANSNNPLVVIQKIHPIQVAFSVPETNLPELQKRMENGKLRVDVTFAGNENHPISGVLSFLNNTVDSTTGTIQLIGDFDNANGKLFPGQFVNTTLTLSQEANATVVPAQAVQNGPDGQFVFVVQPDNTVANVPVVVSNTTGGLDVIQKGVQPGDQVVTDGQANLVTGSKIRIKDANGNASGADQGAAAGNRKADDPSSAVGNDKNSNGNANGNANSNANGNANANVNGNANGNAATGAKKHHGAKPGSGGAPNSTGGTP